MKSIQCILTVALAVCLIAATAEAGHPRSAGFRVKTAGYGGGGGHRGGGLTYGVGGFGGFGYGSFGPVGGFTPYSTGRIPVPPYFSLHPPVYYSAPVPRTYGYSPFAYPGSVRTPEVVAPVIEPQVIDNQYCPAALKKLEQKEETEKANSDGFASKAQWIGNPYVRNVPKTVVDNAPVVAYVK